MQASLSMYPNSGHTPFPLAPPRRVVKIVIKWGRHKTRDLKGVSRWACRRYHPLNLCAYGVATISRLLKSIGLFCRISSVWKGSFAKETYNLKEPTNRSHPISMSHVLCRMSGTAHSGQACRRYHRHNLCAYDLEFKDMRQKT